MVGSILSLILYAQSDVYINPDPPLAIDTKSLSIWIYQTRISLVVNHSLIVFVKLLNENPRIKLNTTKMSLLYLTMTTYIWVVISCAWMVYQEPSPSA